MVTISVSRDSLASRIGNAIISGMNPEYLFNLQEFRNVVEDSGSPTVYLCEAENIRIATVHEETILVCRENG